MSKAPRIFTSTVARLSCGALTPLARTLVVTTNAKRAFPEADAEGISFIDPEDVEWAARVNVAPLKVDRSR
jgi:hypothetical protein